MKNERLGIVDLYKFIGSLLILTCHIEHLLFCLNRSFFNFYELVELFFMITGYFTFSHFCKSKIENTIDEKCKISLKYTFNKFKVFLPYVFIAVILCYIFCFFTDRENTILSNLPFEIFLLSSIFNMPLLVTPLWFLSSMLCVFPVFCLICQCKSKYFVYLVAIAFTCFYYGYFGVDNVGGNPKGLIRAFSGLLLGVLVYAVSIIIKQSNINVLLLTIVEQGALILSIYSMYKNYFIMNFNLMCFFIGLSIMFSGKSYTKYINGKFISFLGQVSMIMYIFHWVVGKVIYQYNDVFLGEGNKGIIQELGAYYIISFTLSVIAYLLIEKIKKNKIVKVGA